MITIDVKILSLEEMKKRIELAQKRLDTLVINDSEKYVPFKNGGLRASAHIATVIGSGLIVYNTPYAHYQYFGKDMVGVETKKHWAEKYEPKEYNGKLLYYHEPGTGSQWFEETKEQNLDKWIKTVGRILDGK